MYFFYFAIISTLRRAWPFIWTNLIPLHSRLLCAKLVEVGSVVLKKSFKSFQCIFIISQLSPLWERCGPSFAKTWIPFTQVCYVPSLVEIGLVVLEKMKIWKVYRRTDGWTDRRKDRQTDNGRQVIRKAHWSFQLSWAKIS